MMSGDNLVEIEAKNLENDPNSEFTRLEYYKFARDEIQREDNITHQRLTSSLTFQGFLVASVSIMVGRFPAESNQQGSLWELHWTILIMLLAAGLLGFLLSVFSWRGVKASRLSLKRVREEWEKKDEEWKIYPKYAPQITGRRRRSDPKGLMGWLRLDIHETGSSFSTAIPGLFAWMWFLYLGYIGAIILSK